MRDFQVPNPLQSAPALKTTPGETFMADGPSPTPWPKTTTKVKEQPWLLADGPSPTPWPK